MFFFNAPGHVNGTSQVSPTERQSSWPYVFGKSQKMSAQLFYVRLSAQALLLNGSMVCSEVARIKLGSLPAYKTNAMAL